MSEEAPEKRRGIKSFAIRSGRMTKAQQQAWKDHWPELGMTLSGQQIGNRDVFGNDNPLVLEIGFGMGGSLMEMAVCSPQTNFIGVEVHRPGVGALLIKASKAGLKNLKVYNEDANDVLDQCVPNSSLCRVQLFFPDPWHKTKHTKRRLVQSGFVQRIRQKLQLGGVFHMATDWEPYAKQMMRVMSEAEGYENLSSDNGFSERPNHRPITKFEIRGQGLGHGVWDLMFQRSN